MRDSFSFAGDHDRANINVVTVQPLFNWTLPQRWFITFGPEIKFDTLNDWNAFVPFDITGRPQGHADHGRSVQGDVALIDAHPDYDWPVEFRVGFFF